MPNQKLLETIACLSEKERRRLRDFVNSPYHNSKFNKAKICQLLDHLLEESKVGDEAGMDKADLCKLFFPEHQFKEKSKNPIDSLASDLFSLVRQFILQKYLTADLDDRAKEQLAMAQFYGQRNRENRFRSSVEQFRKLQAKRPYKDAEYYHLMFKMEEEIAFFQSMYNTYADDSNLVTANIALDNYYALAKSEVATSLKFQTILANIDAQKPLLLSDYLFSILPEYEALQNPLTLLYGLIVRLLEEPGNEELFQQLSRAVREYEPLIPKDKFRNIMAFYRNISGRKYQLQTTGETLFKSLFPLYKEHLDKGYFHTHGTNHILPASLKVLTNLAIKCDEAEWASVLLENYPPARISGTKYPVEAHNLCLAEVLFYEEKYEEAQTHLVYRNFENINYSILADILLLKIYYVTKNELLTSRTSALGQKIRRSQIAAPIKKQYLNFLKLLGQIEKLKWTGGQKAKNRIQERLKTTTPLIERAWLGSILQSTRA